jgi:hypothetical protein
LPEKKKSYKISKVNKKKQAKVNMGESYNDKDVFFNKKFLTKNPPG